MKRYLLLAMLTLGTAACGGGTEVEEDGTLLLVNGYAALNIEYVYSWHCDEQPNTTDLLGAGNVLHPGQTARFPAAPGCKTIETLTNVTSGQRVTERNQVTIVSKETATLEVPACGLHCPIE